MKEKLFVLAMLCLAQSIWAQKPDINWFANNSEADIFYISNANELAGLAVLVNNTAGVGQPMTFSGKTIVLTKDINLSAYGANYNNKKGWTPIGNGSFVFSGTFDGNGKKITGLYIKNEELKHNGLFGYIKDGTVKNLGVENVNITGIEHVGGIVGYGGENTQVVNCYSSGKVTGSINLGGIIGYLYGDGGNITDSYSSVNINGLENVGGVLGYLSGNPTGNITNCYSTGTISGGNSIGGVAGRLSGNVTNCYSSGTIKGNNSIGGVVGRLSGNVTNCYSSGTIKGNNSVGGVAGECTSCKIANSYSIGAISGVNNVSGILGDGKTSISGDSRINSSFSTASVNGNDYVGGIAGNINGYITSSYSIGIIKGNNNVGGLAGNARSVTNSYSISAVSGNNSVGGVLGNTDKVYGKVYNCAALNSSVKATGTSFGRIIGTMKGGEIARNLAFNGMINNIGNTLWLNKGAENANGADISNIDINVEGTLGGRFTNQSGLVIEDGKLPGLGAAVDMPKHLLADLSAVAERRTKLIRLTDTRDGKRYRAVKIGNQIWMAENLNYEANGSKCYKNKPEYCQKYGRLYDYETATTICPNGWHLPEYKEWEDLLRFVDSNKGTESPYYSKTAGRYLKATSGWRGDDEKDYYGFTALPGGFYQHDGNFIYADDNGYWWSSSESERSTKSAYKLEISYGSNAIGRGYEENKSNSYSVRCLQNEGNKEIERNDNLATTKKVNKEAEPSKEEKTCGTETKKMLAIYDNCRKMQKKDPSGYQQCMDDYKKQIKKTKQICD